MARNDGSGLEPLAAPADPSGGTGRLRVTVDVLAFCCELWMLATLALSGFDLGNGGLMGICLAVFYPALAVAIWAAWLAPRGRAQLSDPWRFVVQLVLFAATAVIASLAGDVLLGVLFAVVAAVVFGLVRLVPPAVPPVQE